MRKESTCAGQPHLVDVRLLPHADHAPHACDVASVQQHAQRKEVVAHERQAVAVVPAPGAHRSVWGQAGPLLVLLVHAQACALLAAHRLVQGRTWACARAYSALCAGTYTGFCAGTCTALCRGHALPCAGKSTALCRGHALACATRWLVQGHTLPCL